MFRPISFLFGVLNVQRCKKELDNYSNIDVLIFRMYSNGSNVIFPYLHTDNFYLCHVGISYVIKTKIFKSGLQFIPCEIEDYDYLHRIRENKYIIMISPYVKYFVRSSEDIHISKVVTGDRVLINN